MSRIFDRSRELHEKRGDNWPCATCWPDDATDEHRPVLYHGERIVCTCGDFNCASLD